MRETICPQEKDRKRAMDLILWDLKKKKKKIKCQEGGQEGGKIQVVVVLCN